MKSKYLRQYFYPIRAIGSVKNANLEAAVNLEVIEENKVRIGLNTTSRRENAKVVLSARGEVLYSETI